MKTKFLLLITALLFFGMNSKVNAQNYSAGTGSGTGGAENTTVGINSGILDTGIRNSMFGFNTGSTLTTGIGNTFIGYKAGLGISTGNYNTIIGNPGPLNNTLGAIILSDGSGSRQRIFINSQGNVGINLGNNVPAANILEVKANVAGRSGIRLTTLPNTEASYTNPTNKVLSVNTFGDIVLVDDKQSAPANTTVLAGSNINVTGSAATGYTISSPPQILSLNGNNLIISGGNIVALPTTSIVAGNNVALTGTGTLANPYVINSTAAASVNIYGTDGSLSSNRVVTMGDNNLNFSSSSATGGKVIIGNVASPGDYKLYVGGGILAEKIRVALASTANWADYVFAPSYKLMPLNEIETFIKINKHLPGISSSEQLVKSGLDVAQMQAKQMEKIEELTLHLIEQNKVLESQKLEIEALQNAVKSLLEKK
jgi:trimeric autotransporter adhesin